MCCKDRRGFVWFESQLGARESDAVTRGSELRSRALPLFKLLRCSFRELSTENRFIRHNLSLITDIT